MQNSIPVIPQALVCQTQAKKNIQEIRPWLYKPKKSKFGMRRCYKYNDQHWTIEQNSKYAEFLVQYIDLFNSDPNRKRKYHLNRMVSRFVATRSPIQCRSHHQRMLKAYGTFQNIVQQIARMKAAEAEMERSVTTDQLEVEESQKKSQQQERSVGLSALPHYPALQFRENFEASDEFFGSEELIISNFFDF